MECTLREKIFLNLMTAMLRVGMQSMTLQCHGTLERLSMGSHAGAWEPEKRSPGTTSQNMRAIEQQTNAENPYKFWHKWTEME
jgi:hypothetical protein